MCSKHSLDIWASSFHSSNQLTRTSFNKQQLALMKQLPATVLWCSHSPENLGTASKRHCTAAVSALQQVQVQAGSGLSLQLQLLTAQATMAGALKRTRVHSSAVEGWLSVHARASALLSLSRQHDRQLRALLQQQPASSGASSSSYPSAAAPLTTAQVEQHQRQVLSEQASLQASASGLLAPALHHVQACMETAAKHGYHQSMGVHGSSSSAQRHQQLQQQEAVGSRSSAAVTHGSDGWVGLLQAAHATLSGMSAQLAACSSSLDTHMVWLDAQLAAALESSEGVFACPICMGELSVQDCFMVSACNHRLCRSCAFNTVTEDMRQQVVASCPVCKATPCPRCPAKSTDAAAAYNMHVPGTADLAEVPDDAAAAAPALAAAAADDRGRYCCMSQQDLALLLPDEEYIRYLRMEAAMAMAAGLFMRCPRHECGEGVDMPEGEVHFTCPTCSYEFCMSCGVAWHEDSTCEQYQAWAKDNAQGDAEFEAFHRQHGSKKCPSCGHAAVKQDIHQCNKTTCGRCRVLFCWVCGQRIDSYQHFNDPRSPCYNMLFHGVPGH